VITSSFKNYDHFINTIKNPLTNNAYFSFQENIIPYHKVLEVAIKSNEIETFLALIRENNINCSNVFTNSYKNYNDHIISFCSKFDSNFPKALLPDAYRTFSTFELHVYNLDNNFTYYLSQDLLNYFSFSLSNYYFYTGSSIDLYKNAYSSLMPSLYSVLLKFFKSKNIITQIGKGKGNFLVLRYSEIDSSIYDSFVEYFDNYFFDYSNLKNCYNKDLNYLSSAYESLLKENISLKQKSSSLEDLVYHYSVATWH
jgi:hypothetical protein